MFRVRIVLPGVVALLIVGGVTAQAASAAGPFWHVANAKLTTGIRQQKLQLKITEAHPTGAVLKVPGLAVEIECRGSKSEGGTIEGNGNNQGQGKGRLTFSQCKVLKPKPCAVESPITTNSTISYLAEANTQTGIVDVFEPAQGTVLAVVKLAECGVALTGENNVQGDVAAEVIPAGTEAQENLLVFPAQQIAKIKHEGVEKEIKLSFLTFPADFNAVYGSRLETNEPFGVFAT